MPKLPKYLVLMMGCLLLAPSLMARRASIPNLEPTTYHSPSGEFSLYVNPSDRMGVGSAEYRFQRGDEVLWEGERELTLQQALVTDKGEVVGHGYTSGIMGRANPPDYMDHGETVLWILEHDGSPRLEKRFEREFCPIPSSDPSPVVNSMLVSPEGDWVKFSFWRCSDRTKHSGNWVFGLSDGELIHHREMEDFPTTDGKTYRHLTFHAVVEGMPYIVGSVRDLETRTVFLMDPRDRILWSQVYPAAPYRRDAGADHPFVLGSEGMGTFSLYDAEMDQKVVFVVMGAGEDLIVTELERGEYVPPTRITVESRWMRSSPIELEHLGTIHLNSDGIGGGDESVVQNMLEYDFDTDGSLVYLRGGNENHLPAIVVVSTSGEILTEISIPQENMMGGKVVRLGGGRFAVGGNTPDGAMAWLGDLKAGSFGEPFTIGDGGLLALSAFESGDLMTLIRTRHRYSSSETLSRITLEGEIVWSITTGGFTNRESFWQAHDAVVLAGDEVGVLRTVSRDIQVFDPDGNYSRLIDLEAGWGRRPNYPTTIVAAPGGGFLIRDFNGPFTMVECGSDGTVRREFTMQYADGYNFEGSARFSPDGKLWGGIGNALMQLDESGQEIARVGVDPSDVAINPMRIAISHSGLIHVVDRRTYNIHVYNPDGEFLHSCKVEQDDFPPNQHDLNPVFKADGGFVLSHPLGLRPNSIEFGPDGTRLGLFEPENRDSHRVSFAPDGKHRWVAKYTSIILQDIDGTVIRELTRDANNNWIDARRIASIAPDGSVAFAAGRSESTLVFSADGEPLAALNAPGYGSYLSYDGKWIARPAEGVVYLTRADGSEAFRAAIPSAGQAWPRPFLMGDLGELWTWDSSSMNLERYRLPD